MGKMISAKRIDLIWKETTRIKFYDREKLIKKLFVRCLNYYLINFVIFFQIIKKIKNVL